MKHYRIRRCGGNTSAWLLCMLVKNGNEYDSFGTYTTAMSLDGLLNNPHNLTPQAGDRIELQL